VPRKPDAISRSCSEPKAHVDRISGCSRGRSAGLVLLSSWIGNRHPLALVVAHQIYGTRRAEAVSVDDVSVSTAASVH
jgi:hypothetical protein